MSQRGHLGPETLSNTLPLNENDISPPRRSETGTPDALAFLAGGGEMGERTRSFDWSLTPLGPMATWPQSLKIALRIMLGSRYAMWLAWGPEFTFFYNDAYAKMTLGPKHPWALGRSAREVWSEIWNDIGPRAEKVVRTGEATWDEGLLLILERRGFPEETYHTFSYSPIPSDDGTVGGMLCVVTEDTERTLGERRLRTLRELAASIAAEGRSAEDACKSAARTLANYPADLPFVLIYLLSPDARTAQLAGSTGLPEGSPAAPPFVSLTAIPSEMCGWPMQRVLETGQAEVVSDLAARFGTLPGQVWPESPHQAMVVAVAKPGQTRPAGFLIAGVSPRLVFNEEYRGFLALLAGHVATAVANARVYQEERRRAESLAELDRAKTAFFSNVSHEFRTPLTLMLSPLEDILAKPEGEVLPENRKLLQVVHRNGQRLQRLVNSLLDFSRIEAGRVRAIYQPTDLSTVTEHLASVFRSACEKAGLELKVECGSLPEHVYVDQEMWEKIVLNLLSNAFKFTFEGGITVTLEPRDHAVELQVRDTGIGIPESEMPRLFERFHRVENARGRTHEGSGIGLALVHELVKLHGGSISAQSVLNEGTRFRVLIPLGNVHLPADQVVEKSLPAVQTRNLREPFVEEALRWLPTDPSQFEAEKSAQRTDAEPVLPLGLDSGMDRARILLADDNADLRDYISSLLEGQFDVKSVSDGEAALRVAREERPDLILSDVMMPRLDGFGLLAALKTDSRTMEIPVVLLSARAGEESRIEGMRAGADDYLVKPFSGRELRAVVSAHVRTSRVRRTAAAALRASEERFRHMANNAPVMIWVTEADGSCTFLSKSWYEFTGQAQEEALGFGWVNAVHPDDRTRAHQAFVEANSQKVPFRVEYRLRRKDGDYRWAIDASAPRFDDDGRFLGYIGSVIDITDRKNAEQHLQERTFQQSYVVKLSDALRRLTDPVAVQAEASRLLGEEIDADRVVYFEVQGGDYVVECDYAKDVEPVRGRLPAISFGQKWLDAIQSGHIVACNDVEVDGTLTSTELESFKAIQIAAFVIVPLLKRGGIVAGLSVHARHPRLWTGVELSLVEETAERTRFAVERARTEAALRISEERYRTLFSSMDEGYCVVEIQYDERGVPNDYVFVEVNPAYSKHTGLVKPTGRSARALIPGLESHWTETLGRVAQTGEPTRFEEVASSLGRWFAGYAFRLGDAGSNKVAILFRDVTARRQIERLQADHRQALELVAQDAPLESVFKTLVEMVEQQFTESMFCSIMMLNKEGTHLIHASPPRWPEAFTQAIDNLTIGPAMASCGSAAFRREPVYVADIETDPLWANFRSLALSQGLRACWSTPIFSRSGSLLGTLAMNFHSSRQPTEHDIHIAGLAARTAAIAIDRKRDQDDLRLSERRERDRAAELEAVMAAVPAVVWIAHDPACERITGNRVAYEILRMPVGANLSKTKEVPDHPMPFRVLRDGVEVPVEELPVQKAAAGIEVRDWEEEIRFNDGSSNYLFGHATPLKDEDGRVRGSVAAFVDITDRKRVEAKVRKSEEQYRTMVEQVKDYAIFTTDSGGRATSWNEGVGRVLGFEESEWIGQDITNLIFTPEDVVSGVARAELEEAAETGRAGDDRWMMKKGRTRFFAIGVTTALRDEHGKLLGFTKVMRDQTDRKRLEDELRHVAVMLSEADRRKDEFLATLAHELRNPLAPIRSGLQILKLSGGNPTALEKSRAMMERQVEQMVRLIDDLMDLSRISRGKIVLRKARLLLVNSVQDAIETSRPLIDQQNHRLEIQLPNEEIYVDGDPTRLTQVFANLLNNAAKYTEPGGRIRLDLKRRGQEAIVTIEDNGVGIPENMLPSVFDMFTQVDRSLEKSQGGLGIGLNIVKRLVEKHGGSISASSRGHGMGSKFTVRLPVVTNVHNDSSVSLPAESVASGPRKILVVDDNQDGALSLALMLEVMGNKTQTAHDGLQAVEVAGRFRPDVILMDIGMPRLNGLDAARRIREQPWGKSMILVAQTGWGQEDDKQKSQAAGFNFHMVKPVDPAALEKLLVQVQSGS